VEVKQLAVPDDKALTAEVHVGIGEPVVALEGYFKSLDIYPILDTVRGYEQFVDVLHDMGFVASSPHICAIMRAFYMATRCLRIAVTTHMSAGRVAEIAECDKVLIPAPSVPTQHNPEGEDHAFPGMSC